MKTLCIYHGNCADGFGAAWVVRRALGEDKVEFHAGVYGAPPPDVTGRDVVLVDFSYKRPVLEAMAAVASSVTVLDHHKTAQDDLTDIAGVEVVFDMNRSGAMIAWDYFFPNVPAPTLLHHIQDRDLWRFAMSGTREIQSAVFSYPYDFEVWDELMDTLPVLLAQEGACIERKHHKDVAELVADTKRRLTIGGFDVPAANLPYIYASDAGHMMCAGEPFAATYYQKADGSYSFSLRSTDSGVDVSAVAKQYGGGGHRNASGFRVTSLDELVRKV